MFREFFRFEISYWLRGWMIYIFVAVTAVLFGCAAGSDFVRIGQALGNTHANAPFVVALWYAVAGVLTCFMATAIYDSSASRDFSTKMSEILFSKPLSKWGYLLGRFSAATIIAILPALGISIGIIAAQLVNFSDVERWGPTRVWDHLLPIVVFTIPNTLLFGAVVFAIATTTRNTLYSFLGVLLVLVGYSVAQGVSGSLDYETFTCLSDPFGADAFAVATKYWTVDDRNTRSIPFSPLLVGNRVLWLNVSALVFGIAAWRFTFETRERGARKRKTVESVGDETARIFSFNPQPKAQVRWRSAIDASEAVQPHSAERRTAVAASLSRRAGNGSGLNDATIPKRTPRISWFAQFGSAVRSDLSCVVASKTFLVVLCLAGLNTGAALFLAGNELYGTPSFPVTYKMIDLINGSWSIFPMAIITYFTGVLIWRDREYRLEEIVGATPASNSVFVVSRFTTMMVTILVIQLLGICLGAFCQWTQGYTRYQWGVYLQELVGIGGARFAFLIVAGFVAHTLAPNKYAGYAVFVLFVILNGFLWQWLRWETLVVRFGRLPNHTYSDMFGIAPYQPGLVAFGAYWAFVSSVLLWLSTVGMHRGVATKLRTRMFQGFRGLSPASWGLAVFAIVASTGMASWLTYNTQVLNTIIGSADQEQRQVDYERIYEKISTIAQPKIVSINYTIDLYPETRNMTMRAEQIIVNKSNSLIDTLYVNRTHGYDTTLEIPGATLQTDDKRLWMQVYRLNPPMAPGQSIDMKFSVISKTRGIENDVSQETLVQNGTFFNNKIAPSFGYDPERRLIAPKRRRAFGLDPVEPIPKLTRVCTDACQLHYLSMDSDWVSIETVISTSTDQIAVAPGSMIESWEKDGRNYYRYRLDHPSLNFYSFISAKYAVERRKVGDVDTEVYYHPEHRWNVEKMSQSIADTLEYCSAEFGPYKHKQARIIEFPRVASFAQAFPGTMPYSESIGFIANLEKPDDIDLVTYVVAHEIAHQWWGYQVIGARMQGTTMLSETLAQYTALMVMRRKYGDDMMGKFLRHEMDLYLRARGSEELKERPLMNVDFSQGYIHYQKGSLVLFYLTEMIGEKKINAVLKAIVDEYAYQGPPYPNAHVLVDRLREQTPPELQYLIKDLFEEITLFGNRTLEATAQKLDDGKYKVRLKVECEKFKADETGRETSVTMNDWLEVGAFAQPEKGKHYGQLLHRERVQLTSGEHELEFVVDELPYQAGIDPRNLLIDRMPDDNLKKVTVK